jgi:serine/threonine protein phosphatase PrpC
MRASSDIRHLRAVRDLRVAWGSDVGLLREQNEDSVVCRSDLGVFAVIDGVGGEAAGELAAREAGHVLVRRLARADTTPIDQRIREAVALANNRLLELAERRTELRGMSCVLTVVLVDGDEAWVGHVGDTRLYRLGAGTIEQLSRDHSPVGELEESGQLSEREAMRHPRRNEIFRDVGSCYRRPEDEGFVEISRHHFGRDQALLLCSDGLSDQLTSGEILAIVEDAANGAPQDDERGPEGAVARLIATANARGGRDNVSVLLVQGEGYAPARPAVPPQADLDETTHRLAAFAGPSVGRSPCAPARTTGGSGLEPAAARPRAARALLAGRDSASKRTLRITLLVTLLVAIGGLWLALAREGSSLRALANQAPWLSPVLDAVLPAPLLLRVGPEQTYRTIGAALEAARRGATIELEPGEYHESLVAERSVTLRSRVPRAAIVLPPAVGSLERPVALTVHSGAEAILLGVAIAPAGASTLDIGVLAASGSRLVLDNVEIAGANVAAVSLEGEATAELRWCHFHDNAGAGVVVAPGAGLVLHDSLIRDNGTGALARAGVEVATGSHALIARNRFERNRGGAVLLPAGVARAEVESWNTFVGAGVLSSPPAVRPGAAP